MKWHALLTLLLAMQNLDEAARELARRIAAVAGTREPISLTTRNVSSEARRQVEQQLRRQGLRLAEAGAKVHLTLSENPQNYLWIAQTDREVIIVSRPRPPAAAQDRTVVAISKNLLLEQDDPILDLAPLPDDLLVLDATKVSFYKSRQSLPITHSRPWPRDLRGRLSVQGDLFRADLPGVVCQGAIQPSFTMECRESEEARFAPGRNLMTGASITGWASEAAAIETDCASTRQVLATRAVDFTEPDAIQAYEIVEGKAKAVSAPVEFPGPVTALWPSGSKGLAMAVTRDLKTGRYAAYRLAVSCGH